jgi:hypothetical protein
MAESEPKPKLIELVGPGAGQGWKAVLKNGKPAVVHEIPVPPAEAAAAIPRIQRLADHRHPALSPVLAWGTDPNGIWVAVEPNEGTPLSTLLSRGPLTPPAAAALGAAVLSGVAALHEAGIAMGGFGASAIRVTSNGDVRLAGHPAAAVRGAPAQSDLRADVRSSGMAVCAAFGVDPAGAPAPPNVPPGLVVTMRSMASGAMGPAADRAQGALREMASALLAPDRAVAAQAELATRASGRETPDVTTFLPKEAIAPAPPPLPPQPPAAPAPFVPSAPRDETPVRAPASYEAPARSVQTYPAIPAPTYTGAPTPPAPPAPPAPQEARPVPTWSEAPPRTPAPYEPPAAPAAVTPPAPPPTTTTPPVPARETFPPAPVPEAFPPPPTRETFPPTPSPFTPAGGRSPFEAAGPAPSMSTNPPAAAPPAFASPPAPAPAPPAPQTPAQSSTWTPVEAPVWTPGKVDTSSPPPPWVAGDVAPKPESPVAYSPPSGTPTPPAAAAAESFTVAAASAATAAAAPAPLRAPAPTPARKPTVARQPSGSGTSERPPWLIPAVIGLVLILLIGTGGFILAHRGGGAVTGGGTPSPSARTSPKASPKTSPTATTGPLAVPNYGPASIAPITSVIICSTATPCNVPGSAPETATACDLTACKVEVGIYFSGAQRVPVSYILKFFDRCTGTTTDLPGPNPYTPPGYNIVIPTDHWPVSIPSGVKSGALVAVAQQPAVAASTPLLLGGTSCT